MSSTAQKVPVMVTALGGGSVGTQILKALRLAETPYHIIGGDSSRNSATLGLSDEPYLLPPSGAANYVDTVLRLCAKHDVKALFAGCEAEMLRLGSERDRFAGAGVFLPLQPCDVVEICMDKVKTARFLGEENFSCPPSREICGIEDAKVFPHFPAVLKPATGSGGSLDVHIVQTPEEMVGFAQLMLRDYPRFIAQAYVGRPEDEFTVGVLTDMDGCLVNSIAMRRHILSPLSNRLKVRNRSGREDLGSVLAISNGISQGDIGRFTEVTEPCEALALSLGCRGAINVQCRVVEGEVTVFEINPRFSGTTSLRAMVGYNEPDVLIRKHVFGESVEVHFPYQEAHVGRYLAEAVVEPRRFRNAADAGETT